MQLNANFGTLVRRVHLKGLVNEAAIDFTKDGVAHCQAVDITNTIFIDCEETVSDEDSEKHSIGLGPLSLVAKYTAGDSSVKMEVKDKWAHLRKQGSGSIKILSIEPELVPTRPADSVDVESFFTDDTVEINLDAQIVTNFLEHQAMVDSPSIVFTIAAKTGRATINGNEQAAQQYSVPFGKANKAPAETVRVEIYSNFLVAVFRELDFAHEATLHITAEYPVVITQPGVVWALTPMMV